MAKGEYVRISPEEIARRDKELKAANMYPSNPKRRAAAYRKLLEMRKTGAPAPSTKAPKPAKKSAPVKARAKAAAKIKTPPVKRQGRKAQVQAPAVAGCQEGSWEFRNKLEQTRKDLESFAFIRGTLKEACTEDQNRRLTAIFDFHLGRYEEYLARLNPVVPDEVVNKQDVSPEQEAGDCGGEDCGGDEAPELGLTPPPPPPPPPMPSALPNLPPAPTAPPPFPKPPTL